MLRTLSTSIIVIALGGLTGCQSAAGNGALIGGGTGAALGAIIGHQSHGNTVGGAVIGGAAGALAGGLVGNEVDRQQAERDRDDYDVRYTERRPDGYYYERYYGPPRYYYREVPRGGVIYRERIYVD